MAQPLVIFQGQLSPSVPYAFTIKDAPFDLTGSTATFSMRPVGSSTPTVNHAAASIVSAIAGTVRYDWAGADTATAGTFVGWFTATLPSGKAQDTPEFEIEVGSHATAGTYALVSLEELIDHMKLGNQVRKVTENDHQALRQKILAASSRCEEVTDHRFAVELATTHTFRYDGDQVLDLAPFDLRNLTSITVDTDVSPLVYDSSQYRLEPRNRPHGVWTHVDLAPYTPSGRTSNFWADGDRFLGVGTAAFGREVQVAGDWGWTSVPEGIKHGVLVLAARMFSNPLGAQSIETASVKMQFTRGTASSSGKAAVGDDLPDEVASAWRPYVRAGF